MPSPVWQPRDFNAGYKRCLTAPDRECELVTRLPTAESGHSASDRSSEHGEEDEKEGLATRCEGEFANLVALPRG